MTGVLTAPEHLRALLGIPFSPEQLAAATAPLEPAVVVAGAGSGKTTVMAARVVWLVGSGQVRPDQVLGLTFTNKAAAELSGRVRAALRRAGAGATDPDAEPTIATYHAYASRLVQEHGLRVGAEPQSRLLADASRFQLANRALRETPGPLSELSKPLWMLVGDVVALEAELSEHLVEPAALRASDEALLAELAGAPKQTADLQKVAEAARKRLELTRVVECYRAAKQSREAVDFGDLLALAARLAEDSDDVGEVERERFHVVLLDEYQDTSVAQRRMLVGLFGGGHPVTAVGDPCQAIYGWRGASVANLLRFPTHFPSTRGEPARRFPLVENRRSGSRLLELANTVATVLRRVHEVEPLSPCAERLDSGEARCALLPTYAEELEWAADQVREALDDGTPPGEVAVLVRARSDFAAMHAALLRRDVPVEVIGLGGLLGVPEVADVVATLEVLADPTSNAALVRLLTGPRWRIGPRDLALLGRRAADLLRVWREGGEPAEGEAAAGAAADFDSDPDAILREAVAGVDPAEVVSLVDALERPGGGPYSAEARERFAALAAELRELRAHAAEPLLDLITRIVTLTGLDVEIAIGPPAVTAGRRETFGAFLDHAARFVDLDGDASVVSFLAFLRAAEQYDRGLDTATPSGSDTVKLLTAHKAKGLEWDVVVVPFLSKGVFPSSQGRDRWTNNGQVLPYPLRGDYDSGLPAIREWSNKGLKAFAEALTEQAELEERRLGYVAFTRARRLVIASGHWWGPSQKRLRGPSPFLEEVRAHCLSGKGEAATWAAKPADEARNPQLVVGQAHAWPVPLEPAGLASRRAAARAVLGELDGLDRPEDPLSLDEGLSVQEADLVASWDRDVDLLVEELRWAHEPELRVRLPAALSTTQLLQLAQAPDDLARQLSRPLPRRPAASARRGTRFHAWVESEFEQRPLLEPDDLPGAEDAELGDDADLLELQEAFRRSPLAGVRPYAIEAPFSLLLGGRVIRGRIDAIYQTAAGFDVIDWKTNKRQSADPLQLAVYRLAWSELGGVPIEQVGAAFLYVRSGALDRPDTLPGRAELEALIGGQR